MSIETFFSCESQFDIQQLEGKTRPAVGRVPIANGLTKENEGIFPKRECFEYFVDLAVNASFYGNRSGNIAQSLRLKSLEASAT